VTDHTTSDDARRYRSEEEVEIWKTRDPIERLVKYMRAAGLLDDAEQAAILAETDAKVAQAVAAFEAIEPILPEEIFEHVFAEVTPPLAEQRASLMSHLAKGG
jgi:pyruvate dehydrogenase E1 component alpha subunit